jgi:hypothetical protein
MYVIVSVFGLLIERVLYKCYCYRDHVLRAASKRFIFLGGKVNSKSPSPSAWKRKAGTRIGASIRIAV